VCYLLTIDNTFQNAPKLYTNRLVLRIIEIEDAPAIHSFKSDFEVTSRYGKEPYNSLEESERWITQILDGLEKRIAIVWAITLMDKNYAIGSACFWNFDPSFHTAELGYEMNRNYWGRGLMSEALTPIIGFGFDEMGLHRIEALPLAVNDPSKNLLVKLGFTLEGCLRDRAFFRDKFIDQLYFGLLKEDWNRSRKGVGTKK
jgi:[ribosomal protein S5]-alanine N-acetyltransferase